MGKGGRISDNLYFNSNELQVTEISWVLIIKQLKLCCMSESKGDGGVQNSLTHV